MFAFRLALALGFPHPDVLLRQVTRRQMSEWWEYDQIEPFGEERGDLRIGILCSLVANALGGGKGGKALPPSEFMPDFKGTRALEAAKKQSVEEQKNLLLQLVQMTKPKPSRKKKQRRRR